MTDLDNEPKKLWFKALALTALVFISKDIYAQTKFKKRINEITVSRFNIAIL